MTAVLGALARILACVLLATGALAQKDAAAQFERRELELALEQSQRHLEYGLELRKQGMTAQAAEQIVLAAELGKGRHPGATHVLRIMRQYDAAFWKRHGSRATPGKVEAYGKKARKLLETDAQETLQLANWAAGRDCAEQAHALYRRILEARDEPLEFDAKGQLVVPGGVIPKGPSQAIRESAIAVNGRWWVRDELLSKLPALSEVFEVASPELRVRSTTTLQEAQEVHAMCSQLLPALAAEVGAAPQKRLNLFVLGKRAEYEQALDALGIGAHKIVQGVANPSPLVAFVLAEGIEPAVTRGVCLHEVTHLFAYAVTYVTFPAWYSEGFADTFGGTDTFTWADGKLTTGGMLARSRLEALKSGAMPLAQLLVADQFAEWQRGKEHGLAFLAQSWAFLRYLRTGAGEEIASRFEAWEARCIGQALGYEIGGQRSQATAAQDLFLELFAKDLAQLQAGFDAWLARL